MPQTLEGESNRGGVPRPPTDEEEGPTPYLEAPDVLLGSQSPDRGTVSAKKGSESLRRLMLDLLDRGAHCT